MTAAAEPIAPSRRTLWRARLATLALFFVCGAALGVWAAHIPLLKSGLALDDSTLGLVMLAMGIGAVVAMPCSGALIHRFGAVAVSIASGLAIAVALALPPHMPDPVTLGLSAFLLGLSLGGIDIAMNAHAAAVEKAFGRPIMSSIHAFFSIGGLFGAAGAAGLVGLAVGAKLGMGAGGAVVALIVLAAARFLAFEDRPETEGGHGLRLPSRAVLLLGLLTVCSFLCEGAMMEWSALFLRDVAGASLGLAAAGYAAFSATMTIGRLLGDRFVEALGPARAVQLSGAVAAVSLLVVTFAPNPWVAFAGILAAGLGFANIVPPLFSAATRAPGVAPAAALAMVASMGYSGGLLGPPAIGFLSDAFGLRFGFGLLVVAAAIVALFARRTISPPSPRP
ncbi:MFS transporter [Chenggangzhangella methanolivorans]|uniref:MFS transporter n=1 Tax=Chenggangzhangella methanolivorans TaxID=1437009 RepID=A0A9E6UL64_9HYPH|nr:MFS transporter [Chenggangzhangella methanolivorans]QZN98605.1 MFS transporter [Chenggangzhangella methanolivorans]